jgi:hypothetical protein
LPSSEYEPFRPRRLQLAPQPAAASITYLRQEAFPALVAAPSFGGGAGIAIPRPDWVGRLWQYLGPRALVIAAIAAIMLALAVTVPPLVMTTSSSASIAPLRSSAGTTAGAATTVENLGVSTFIGRIPFVQQARYMTSISSNPASPERFVEGAREASVASYLQDVGAQVTLPYVSGAVQTKEQIEAWNAAVTELQRQEAVREASARQIWQPPPLEAGIALSSTVTFYSCIGNGFCNNMASGIPAYSGAAACSFNIPFGTRFYIASDPSQRVFTCMDRGALAPNWVDIWFYDAADGWAWQAIVGTHSDIVIVN